jgi:hypothetical protein
MRAAHAGGRAVRVSARSARGARRRVSAARSAAVRRGARPTLTVVCCGRESVTTLPEAESTSRPSASRISDACATALGAPCAVAGGKPSRARSSAARAFALATAIMSTAGKAAATGAAGTGAGTPSVSQRDFRFDAGCSAASSLAARFTPRDSSSAIVASRDQ